MPIATGTAIAAAVGANLVGGVIGSIASSGDRDSANRAYAAALEEIQRVGAPPDLARQIILGKFQEVGVLTPELEKAVELDAPKVAQIKEDPGLRGAQMSALGMLGKRAATGMSAEDRSRLAEIQTQIARDTEAKRQQIVQGYQQRGLGGGGSELAAQLQAASAGAAQAGEEGGRLAAMAQQSALEAARQYGTLGGQIRGQEFDIARTKAGAEDQAALSRFNEATARQQRNVGVSNVAQQQNLANRQRLSEMNVSTANAELLRQRQAEREQYQLALDRASRISDAQNNRGTAYSREAAGTAQRWADAGSAVGRGISAYADKKPDGELSDEEKSLRASAGTSTTYRP